MQSNILSRLSLAVKVSISSISIIITYIIYFSKYKTKNGMPNLCLANYSKKI